MASDTGVVGKNAYIAFGGTALASNYRTLTPNSSIALVDASAGADTGITRLTTLTDSNFSLSLKVPSGANGTTNWVNLVEGAAGTFEYGPEGTTTGNRRAYVVAILESVSEDIVYNDLNIRTLTFQQNDTNGVTYTTY